MKYINIDSLLEIVESKDDELINSYLKLSDYSYDFKNDKGFSKSELTDFSHLMSQIAKNLNPCQKNGYFLGYIASHGVREEFDVLRFSKDSVLNIEVKSQLPSSGISAIKYQLKRHKFLLNILNKKTEVLSYIKDTNKLYKLNKQESIEQIPISELNIYIDDSYSAYNELSKINLSNMIISPYSQPREFATHQYYLTDEQIEIRNEILKSSNKKIGVIGGAGTGKSLLLIDLAKKYKKLNKKAIIIFGSLMEMSEANHITKEIGIEIRPIKYLDFNYLKSFEVILVDEAQRLWEDKFNKLIEIEDKLVIFSADQQQTLHRTEQDINIEKKLLNNPNVLIKRLRDKIRTDPALASFIKKMIDLKARGVQPFNYDKVDVVYFKMKESAIEFIEYMINKDDYVAVEFTEYVTKSTNTLKRKKYYDASKTTHSVLGREFENVIIILDKHIFYNDEGRISSNYSFYPYIESKMIFQAMTRVKQRLLLVVIDNIELYTTIQEIKNWKIMKEVSSERK